MVTRLLIVHPFVQAYRSTLYSCLAQSLRQHGIAMTVASNAPPPKLAARADTAKAPWASPVPTLWVSLPGRDVAVRRLGALPRPDLVIVEQAVKNLETLPLLARKPLGGPSVAMWGHGRSYSTPQGPALAATKQFLTRRSDWFFAYTGAGADYVIARGFPATRVSVLNNTVDTAQLTSDLASVDDDTRDAWSRSLGLSPGRTALFLGGVDKAKGIDFLLESAEIAARMLPGFVLLVGGAGAQLPDVQSAQARGAPVRALGRLDGHAKALALRAADVLAIPEAIGLVAVDCLVAGRPIVSTASSLNGPEGDYLEDGTTAIVADHEPAAYARALTDLLRSPEQLKAMQQACLREAPKYSLDSMVDRFVEGVLSWDEVRRFGL